MTERQPPWASPAPAPTAESSPGRVVRWREVSSGLISGLIVAGLTVGVQWSLDGQRDARADRLEDVRFVRQIAADSTADKGSLRGLDLSNSNLSGLDLAGANLRDANLAGVDLTDTNLIGASLRDADLRGARLTRTILVGADMAYADLTGAELDHPILSPNIIAYEDVVEEAKKRGIKRADRPLLLTGATVSDATIRGAYFDEIVMDNADFSGAVFEYDSDNPRSWTEFTKHASMNGTKFYGADLSGVRLEARRSRMAQGEILRVCADHSTTRPDSSDRVLTPIRPGISCETGGEDVEANLKTGLSTTPSDSPATFMKPMP